MILKLALAIAMIVVGLIFVSSSLFNPATLLLFLLLAAKVLIRRAARHNPQRPSYPSLGHKVFCNRNLP